MYSSMACHVQLLRHTTELSRPVVFARNVELVIPVELMVYKGSVLPVHTLLQTPYVVLHR